MNDIQITEYFNMHLKSLEWDEKDPTQIAMYLRLHDAVKAMFKDTTIIDWEIDGCIEELKGDWMSVALTGKDDLGNIYNACGETFISNPQVENITDIQCEDVSSDCNPYNVSITGRFNACYTVLCLCFFVFK